MDKASYLSIWETDIFPLLSLLLTRYSLFLFLNPQLKVGSASLPVLLKFFLRLVKVHPVWCTLQKCL